MGKLLKNDIGITLIALVVTIIVLIIISGVSISLILGQNGIINRSLQGKEDYEIAANEEQFRIAKTANELDSYVEGSRETVTLTQEEWNRVQSTIENLSTRISALESRELVTESFTKDNLVIAKDSTKTDIEFDISKEGYRPLMHTVSIVNGSTDGINCSMIRLFMNNLNSDTNKVFIGVKNTHTSASAKIKINIRVLYEKIY